MKISHKLVGSFIGISLLTGVVGAVAVIQGQQIAETLAMTEAEHVAEVMAASISHSAFYDQKVISTEKFGELQHYTNILHDLQKREIVVVDRQKLILADAVPENVGTIFHHDQGNEIRQTMQDRKPRIFLEKSVDYPQGIKLIVVPLKAPSDTIGGAVVLEWSSLYDEAIAQARPLLLVIGLTSLGGLVLALLVGLRMANSITKPLQAVTTVAQQVTQTSNFDLQASVTTTDEIGILATQLNGLIKQVKILLNEKEQRSEELQQTLNQLQTSQMQLIQNEKMASLGNLVAGVAHEINNPINFIHGNLTHVNEYVNTLVTMALFYQQIDPKCTQDIQAFQEQAEDWDIDFILKDLPKTLLSMKVGTDRIRQIVLSLRNFSRLDEASFKTADIHEGIDSTLLILGHRLKAYSDQCKVEIIKDYGNIPPVECYPAQLNQVFMNLLANSLDALEEDTDSGKLSIVNDADYSMPKIWISTQMHEPDQIEIRIRDNGCGIKEEIKTKIFDHFFTTKIVGKGTGLGLAISRQIINEKHAGTLSLNSSPGQGTEFIIRLSVKL